MAESRIFKRLKSGDFRKKSTISSYSGAGTDEDELDATNTIEDDESRRKREEHEDTTPCIELKLNYDYKQNQFRLLLERCKNLALPEDEGAEAAQAEDKDEALADSGVATEVDLNTRVKFRLLPNMSNDAKRMSSVKKKTRNPKWMKEFKWSIGKPMLELLNLWVTVWDVRFFRSPLLVGEVLIPLRYQTFKGQAVQRYNLSLPYSKMEVIPIITPYRGEIVLAVKFEPHNLMAKAHEAPDAEAMAQTAMQQRANRIRVQSGGAEEAAVVAVAKEHRKSVFQRAGNLSFEEQGDLHVEVRAARRLLAADGNPCTSYCQVTLRPLRGPKGDRTSTVGESNDPQWNHTVHFQNVTIAELQKQCLQLSVWNKGRIGNLWRKTLLGGVRLNMGPVQHSQEFRSEFLEGERQLILPRWMDARGDEVLTWVAALQRPNTWIDATLLLRPLLVDDESATAALSHQAIAGSTPVVH